MTPLDYILVTILGFCLVRGIFRGLVKEVSGIVGVLAGFYFAYTYHGHLSALLAGWLPPGGYAGIVGFLILFVGIYLAINLLAALLKYLLNIAAMGWTDRIGGLLVGGVKGVLILAVLVAMLTTFLPKDTKMLKASITVRHVMPVSTALMGVVSTDLKAMFDNHLQELKTTWQQRRNP